MRSLISIFQDQRSKSQIMKMKGKVEFLVVNEDMNLSHENKSMIYVFR